MIYSILLAILLLATSITNFYIIRAILNFKIDASIIEKSQNTFEAVWAIGALKQVDEQDEENDIEAKGEKEVPALRNI